MPDGILESPIYDTCADDDTVPAGSIVGAKEAEVATEADCAKLDVPNKLPVNCPTNEPVNDPVLICVELLTVPAGKRLVT